MSLIRLEKSWSYNIGFALAPDSNVNSATSSASTEILGLPFQLDEDARRRSGVGVSVEAGGEIAPRIGKRARLRLGAQAQRREYAGQAFDDMSLILQGGPRLILAKWDMSLLGTAYRRWYGGDRLSDGRGGRLELIHYPSGRMQVAAGLFLQKVSYRAIPEQDGMWFGGNVNVLRALSPSSAVIARLGFVRQGAKEAQFANRSASLATGYYRDISGGFSIYIEPAYTTVRYDGRDLLFAKRRSDQIAELTVSLLNRRIVASRFTPRISITRTQRFSNIDLYDFGKTRLEIGLTSDF